MELASNNWDGGLTGTAFLEFGRGNFVLIGVFGIGSAVFYWLRPSPLPAKIHLFYNTGERSI
jgi:hypothetical protein